jgi:TP901-1 family phage major tail protein
MAIINATDFKITNGSAVIENITEASITVSMATRDVTSKDSGGNRRLKEGLKQWSFSCSGHYDPEATEGASQAFADLVARTAVAITCGEQANSTKRYSGNAYITSYEVSAGFEDNVSFSISGEGDGALSEQTVAAS